jgi:hypothetical protein
MSFAFLAYSLWIEWKKTVSFIFFIYLISLTLDLFYNNYHHLDYSLGYYATVNLIHILFLLVLYGFINYKNRIIIMITFVLFVLNFYFWLYWTDVLIIFLFIDIPFMFIYFNIGKIERFYQDKI